MRYTDPTGLQSLELYQGMYQQAPIVVQGAYEIAKEACKDPVVVTTTTTTVITTANTLGLGARLAGVFKSGIIGLLATILVSPYVDADPDLITSNGVAINNYDVPDDYYIFYEDQITSNPITIKFPDGSSYYGHEIIIDENGTPVLIGDPNAVSPLSTASQDDAFNDALKDALIAPGTEPYRIDTWVPLTERNRTTPVLDDDGNILYTENSYYINEDGKKIVIQHHPDGHPNYNTTTPHYNIRDVDEEGKPIRNSKPEGSKDHYNYEK